LTFSRHRASFWKPGPGRGLRSIKVPGQNKRVNAA
jgi:hypothetical protein